MATNRDGDLDVVSNNDAPDPKLVYLNNGGGDFAAGSGRLTGGMQLKTGR